MKSCLDLNFQDSSWAATYSSERFLDSICWLLSMCGISTIIVHSAGDLHPLGEVAEKTAEPYGKDTLPRIRS